MPEVTVTRRRGMGNQGGRLSTVIYLLDAEGLRLASPCPPSASLRGKAAIWSSGLCERLLFADFRDSKNKYDFPGSFL